MLTQLQEAWGLYKKRFLSWLGIGLIAGVIELGISGAITYGQKYSISRQDLLFTYTVGTLSQALAFLIAGGMVAAALHQSRTGNLDFRRLIVPGSVAPTLVLLSIAAALSYHVVHWLASTIAQSSYAWEYLIWLLAAPLFALAIPLVVDRMLGPFQATKESLRRSLPKYFGILVAQFLVWMYATIAMMPVFCINQIWTQRGNSGALAFLAPGVALYAFALPLYYLTVSQIYLSLFPDPGEVEQEPAKSEPLYPSILPPN